jgi:hypothetical protein
MQKMDKSIPNMDTQDTTPPTLLECFNAMVAELGDAGTVMELFYLSREPLVLPLVRGWLALDGKRQAEVMRMVELLAVTADDVTPPARPAALLRPALQH